VQHVYVLHEERHMREDGECGVIMMRRNYSFFLWYRKICGSISDSFPWWTNRKLSKAILFFIV